MKQYHLEWVLILLCATSLTCAACSGTPSTPIIPTHTFIPTFTAPPAPSSTAARTSTAEFSAGDQRVPSLITSLFFVDPLHGYAAGLRDTNQEAPRLALADSQDGGLTWQSLPLPDLPIDTTNGIHGGLFFKDVNTGWLFFNGLISTTDAGQHWTNEHPAGQILNMARAPDGTIWALEKKSADTWQVWNVYTPDYTGWTPLMNKFPGSMQGAALTLANPLHAWINQPGESQEAPSILYSTQDGGDSWQSQPSPCNPYGASISSIQAVSPEFLWLGCGQPAGAGSGSKSIFTSADAGKTWQMHGKASMPPQSADTLPISGYFNGLQALSPTFADMTWDRSLMVVLTRDGGETWEETRLPCSTEFSHAFFVDPLHGWAYDQGCINRTLDGGKTWDCTQLPGSQACTMPRP